MKVFAGKLTLGSATNPRLPFDRTVEMIIIGRSFPWKISAVPTVTSSRFKRRNFWQILWRCLRYGVTTPMSLCVIRRNPFSRDFGGSSWIIMATISLISWSLNQLCSRDRSQVPCIDLKMSGNFLFGRNFEFIYQFMSAKRINYVDLIANFNFFGNFSWNNGNTFFGARLQCIFIEELIWYTQNFRMWSIVFDQLRDVKSVVLSIFALKQIRITKSLHPRCIKTHLTCNIRPCHGIQLLWITGQHNFRVDFPHWCAQALRNGWKKRFMKENSTTRNVAFYSILPAIGIKLIVSCALAHSSMKT